MFPNALIYTMNGCQYVVPACNPRPCPPGPPGPQGPPGPPGPQGPQGTCEGTTITAEEVMLLLRLCGEDFI